MENKSLSFVWGTIVVLLLGLFIYAYCTLSYNLFSLFDEAYFYMLSVFKDDVVIYNCPPSLAMDALHALIPHIEQCDILALRQIAFIAKSFALLFLIVSSCIYVYRRFSEKRIYPYLALIAMNLVVGIRICPNVVFSWNDVIFILVTLIFALCLLYSAASNYIAKYVYVALIGVVSLFMLLCNAPAGCVVIALCVWFLIFENNPSVKHSAYVLICGLGGVLTGLVITHFCIIGLPDIYTFIQENIVHTTDQGQASAHGLASVLLVIGFGIRDLTITTLFLCGITFMGVLCQKRFGKSWLTLLSGLVCFGIVYKWQIRPQITMSAIICWFSIMFLLYHRKHNALTRHEWLLILFAFVLPIVAVFGTNTSIIGKPFWSTSASWGFLLFYLYYLSRPEVRKYALCGILIAMCSFVGASRVMNIDRQQYHFNIGSPVARMNLNLHQKAFYDEVYDVLSDNGFNAGQDTILGFCFNDMTILAMNALPYTNDQQPDELLNHNLENLPIPNYMILTEWDSVVLYNHLASLDWDFPKAYQYYKCKYNPDPNARFGRTQSMIYCRKRE